MTNFGFNPKIVIQATKEMSETNYIKRHIEEIIPRLKKHFAGIVITGARQTGKSTMLKNSQKDFRYITFDNYATLNSSIQNPSGFLDIYKPPLVIDEVQYNPNVLHAVKQYSDENACKGEFFITGSQSFSLMKNVSESLAGRVAVESLLPLSLREINNNRYYEPFLPDVKMLMNISNISKPTDIFDLWKIIQQGQFPDLYRSSRNENELSDFYNAYLKTYIERDIKSVANIQDEYSFLAFLRGCASLTGQMLNYSNLANIARKDVTTIQRWLSLLVSSGLVYLLKPYFNNFSKRLVKTPKLYFLDTGLACYLTGWNTPQQLQNGAFRGAIFETFVISEVLKSYYNAGIIEPEIFYYRDKEKTEIDLIIKKADKLYPVEIKSYSDPTKDDISGFSKALKNLGSSLMPGCVICTANKIDFFYQNTLALPVWMV